jgi:C1A family cysteine protease
MKKVIYYFLASILLLLIWTCGKKSSEEEENNPVEDIEEYVVMGLLPTPDSVLQRLDRYSAPAMGVLPEKYDLSGAMPTPGNQRSLGSCTAWAVAYGYKSWQEHIQHKTIYDNSTLMSPAYIYNQIHLRNTSDGGGSYIHEALDLLQKEGVCSLEDMPYSGALWSYTEQPNNQQQNAAKKNRISHYRYFVPNNVEIKSAIYGGNPVIIGIIIDGYKLNSTTENGLKIWRTTDDEVIGRHAMVVVGYDDGNSTFKVLNSWGSSWGNSGYAFIDYDLFADYCYEAFVAEDMKEIVDEYFTLSNVSVVSGQNIYNSVDNTLSLNSYCPITITGKLTNSDSENHSVTVQAWLVYPNGEEHLIDEASYTVNSSNNITFSLNKSELTSPVGQNYAIRIEAETSGNGFVTIPSQNDNPFFCSIVNGNCEQATVNVTTTTPYNISSSGFTSGGTVITDGIAVTEKGICWSTSPAPTVALSTKEISTTSNTSFSFNISNLSSSTKYYVRAFANVNNQIYYGNEVSTTTGQNVTTPIVSTGTVSNITQNSATVAGDVTNSGGAIVTERGICYSSTNPNPTTPLGSSGNGTGNFSCNLTGLNANTTYYVRAYATNSAGTSYGATQQFTTEQNVTTPAFSPQIGVYTDCSGSSWTCGGHTINAGTIKATVVGYSTSSNIINFRIKKCSGNFQHSGTVYVNKGKTCNAAVGQTGFGVGVSEINVTAPLEKGTKTYYIVLASIVGDYYYAQPITVTY